MLGVDKKSRGYSQLSKAFDGMYKTCSGYVTYLKDFKYCPFCGKNKGGGINGKI